MKKSFNFLSLALAITISQAAYSQNWQSTGKDISPSNVRMKLTSAANGSMFIAYDNFNNSGQISVKKYEAGKWNLVGKGEFSFGPAKYISITTDNSGNPVVGYKDDRKLGKAVVQKFDGNNWVDVSPNGPSEGAANNISLKYDKKGDLYIAFSDEKRKQISVRKLTGGQWADVGAAPAADGADSYVSLTFDNSNTPYVSYADDKTARRATVKKLVNNNWVNVGKTTVSAHEAKDVNCEVDSRGTPIVSYKDAFDNGKILVKRLSAKGEWEMVGEPVFTSTYNDNLSMVLVNDKPYVAFHDSRNFDHKVAVKAFDGSKWDENYASNKGGGRFISLAASKGEVYIAYNDNEEENKGTVKKLTK